MSDALTAIPVLGSGLGYRRQIRQGILAAREEIDFLEIITDEYSDNPDYARHLEALCDIFPVITHGVGLSIGSATPLDRQYLRAIKRLSDLTQSPYYSEHLCMTQAPGLDIGHLSPIWFTEEMLATTISRVNEVQDFLEKPLVLENVSYMMAIPHNGMSQTEFFNRLVAATGCGILLDVTNIFINSVNHHFDAAVFLQDMPLDHVIQVHIAGGVWRDGLLIDTHSRPVQEESWLLLELLTSLTKVRGIILEHDARFPKMDVLLAQVRRARALMAGMAN
jgi:uncharacterized protein (UPF0276 family)